MAKEKHLKLSMKGIIILVLFVVGMVIATYFFTSYMLTGSKAAYKDPKYVEFKDGKWVQTEAGKAYTKAGGGKKGKAAADKVKEAEAKAAADKAAKEKKQQDWNDFMENK